VSRAKELRVRDLECPEWADEWQWDRIVAELGDEVIARLGGASVAACACCKSVHGLPVVEQHEVVLRLLCERLGVIVIQGTLAANATSGA